MAGKKCKRSTKTASKSTIQIPLKHQTSSKIRKDEIWDGFNDCYQKHIDLQVMGDGTSTHTNGWIVDPESDDNPQDTNTVVDHEPADLQIQDPNEPVGSWKGNAVGHEAKELLQTIEQHYPDTFTSQRVTIRSSRYWVSNLKELHVFIKGFLETSVDALTIDQISSLEGDLNDFERVGFNLSWARKRLHMVKDLISGNDPLRLELVVLEESLKLSQKELVEVEARLEKARLDYDSATHARNKKLHEMAQKLGAEYDAVLSGNLGVGMLPGY